MATYTPTRNPNPVYGQSGQSVRDLQVQLNTANRGVSGYTPLNEDGKYGPLTLAATKFKAPTAPAQDLSPDRFRRTAGQYDQQISDTNSALDANLGEAPNLESIRASKRGAAQGLIDAITAQFNRTIQEENVAGNARNDRTRALNVGAGLGGSDFASANAIGTENVNKKNVQLIEQERDSKINSILAGIEDRASEQYQSERAAYTTGLNSKLDRLTALNTEAKKHAEQSISSLASTGVSLDKLKEAEPNSYNQLLKEYGGSPLDLEAKYNDSLPDDQKVKYESQIVRGASGNAVVLRYGVNPRTGTIDKREYDLGENFDDYKGNSRLHDVGGVIYRANNDGSLTPLTKKAGTGSGGFGEGGQTADQVLDASRGADKFVDPNVYQNLYKKWISDKQGTLQQFVTKFPPDKYVNPKNTWLPSYLMPKKAAGSRTI